MNEKLIEKKLKAEIEKLGGMCLKFWPLSVSGMPDRLIQLTGGRTYWVELKGPGEEPTYLQQMKINELQRLGFEVFVIDSYIKINEFIRIITE